MRTNAGVDLQSIALGGGTLGDTGTSTATTATTLSDSGKSWATNTYADHVVVTGGVVGVIRSNTGSQLTVDKWYTPGSPTASPATPGTGTYVILSGGHPAYWMGLSTVNTAPSATDTSMASEVTTAGSGLVRAPGTFAHTTGASSYTLTKTYTATASDAFPTTVRRLGVFNGGVVAASTMMFETLLSADATFNAIGDQVVVTETVTE